MNCWKKSKKSSANEYFRLDREIKVYIQIGKGKEIEEVNIFSSNNSILNMKWCTDVSHSDRPINTLGTLAFIWNCIHLII